MVRCSDENSYDLAVGILRARYCIYYKIHGNSFVNKTVAMFEITLVSEQNNRACTNDLSKAKNQKSNQIKNQKYDQELPKTNKLARSNEI